jgi:hypothetical protein
VADKPGPSEPEKSPFGEFEQEPVSSRTAGPRRPTFGTAALGIVAVVCVVAVGVPIVLSGGGGGEFAGEPGSNGGAAPAPTTTPTEPGDGVTTPANVHRLEQILLEHPQLSPLLCRALVRGESGLPVVTETQFLADATSRRPQVPLAELREVYRVLDVSAANGISPARFESCAPVG